MIYGSVCSGIEAATVAWEPLGWKPAWYSEIDKRANRVLEYHYPTIPNYGDLTKLYENKNVLKTKTDLIAGGTPCQSFSYTGLREGLNHPNGKLALEYLRLISVVRPRWFVWENVAMALTNDEGRTFKRILSEIQKIGYGFAYRVLDAQYFGVPQKRHRVFIIGHSSGDYRLPACALCESEDVSQFATERSGRKEKNQLRNSKERTNKAVPKIIGEIDWLAIKLHTEISSTLQAANNGQLALDKNGIRTFTPQECERLMGFPDDYTKIDNFTRPMRKKLCGNSMAVPVMKWIGEGIQYVEDHQEECLKIFPETIKSMLITKKQETNISIFDSFR